MIIQKCKTASVGRLLEQTRCARSIQLAKVMIENKTKRRAQCRTQRTGTGDDTLLEQRAETHSDGKAKKHYTHTHRHTVLRASNYSFSGYAGVYSCTDTYQHPHARERIEKQNEGGFFLQETTSAHIVKRGRTGKLLHP